MSEHANDHQPPEGFEPWGRYAGGVFMLRYGQARERGDKKCNKKLCVVATDLPYLAELMHRLSERDDCFAVKYSSSPKDGMYLGRCFLTTSEAIGQLTNELKGDGKLMVTVQDDDFFNTFREPSPGS